MGEDRYAILYSDGGIDILSKGKTLEDAQREREWSDENERDHRHLSKIIRLTIPAYEVMEDPTTGAATAPKSEVEVLRERVAQLERKLAQQDTREGGG